MTETSPVNPPSKKGAVRKQIADMPLDAVRSKGLQALIARSADFYGPRNEKSLLTEVVYKNLEKGKRANWVMDAAKKHSFTFTPTPPKPRPCWAPRLMPRASSRPWPPEKRVEGIFEVLKESENP
jgi:hypothetical protein